MNILYIHGLGGNKDGANGQYVKAFLEATGKHRVYLDTYDLVSIERTMAQIGKSVRESGIDGIMATSLGAFYALQFQDCQLILTNPCMLPSVEIPKLEPLASETLQGFRMMEERMYGGEGKRDGRRIFAAFADGDELFSYREFFFNHFPAGRVYPFHGNHKLSTETLREVLEESGRFME